MASARIEQWLRDQPSTWLLACAENEGGRAILCIRGRDKLWTVEYFAREAARYANALLDQREREEEQ